MRLEWNAQENCVSSPCQNSGSLAQDGAAEESSDSQELNGEGDAKGSPQEVAENFLREDMHEKLVMTVLSGTVVSEA